MKFNKWTLGLAAVGAVSMASAVRADEAKLVPLNTALSSTVISGYVDVAAQYNPGDPSGKDGATAANQPWNLSNSKVDAFSLNSLVISLDKPLDESPWAAGYHVDLNWGTDAVTPVTGSPVRQAYVTLRTPVGNGIDWKIGGFDGVTGYEGNTGYSNPNYTRSYGYQVNPASELGMIGSYKIVDAVSVQAGIGNRYSGTAVGLSSKDFIGAISITAPDSLGFLKGSVLNLQTVQTADNGGVNNYSVNATLNTPVTGLKVGLAYDKVENLMVEGSDFNIFGLYTTYQATDKLGFNLRGEYLDGSYQGEEVTATVEYDLWANVVSRLEFRWDHAENGVAFNNGSGTVATPNGNTDPWTNLPINDYSNAKSTGDAFLLALNLVYKF